MRPAFPTFSSSFLRSPPSLGLPQVKPGTLTLNTGVLGKQTSLAASGSSLPVSQHTQGAREPESSLGSTGQLHPPFLLLWGPPGHLLEPTPGEGVPAAKGSWAEPQATRLLVPKLSIKLALQGLSRPPAPPGRG